MSVLQRGSSFQAYVAVGAQRLRRNFSTHAEATAWEALARQALERGQPVPELPNGSRPIITEWTLAQAADRCFDLHWKGKASERHVLINVNKALKHFGTRVAVSSISTEQIDDWILALRNQGLSGGTINRNLAALSKIIRTAHESGRVEKMPKFRRQKEGQHRLRWLTVEEVDKALECAKTFYPMLHDSIVISVDTGIRRGELLRLEPRDVVNNNLMVWVTKNEQPRSIPLTKRSIEVLTRLCHGLSPTAKLFPQHEWIRSPWEHVKDLAGLGDDVVWHTLRHTFASRLVQRGVPIQVVKELMGHKTIAMTMRYAKLCPTNHQDAISVLET